MKNNRFEFVKREGSEFSQLVQIMVDTQTGVNYLFVKSGYGAGLTPLLDAEGKPIITGKSV